MVEQYYHSIFWGKKKGFVIKGQNLFFVARRGRPEGVPQIMCDVYIITLLDGRPTWSNVSKLASIKNMKRLLHEIMQWSLFRT